MESLANLFDTTSDSETLKEKLSFFPYVSVESATLAGHTSLFVKVSLDIKDKWINGIYHNSRYSIFTIRDGSIEQISKHSVNKFRKSKAQTLDDVAAKLERWFSAHY